LGDSSAIPSRFFEILGDSRWFLGILKEFVGILEDSYRAFRDSRGFSGVLGDSCAVPSRFLMDSLKFLEILGGFYSFSQDFRAIPSKLNGILAGFSYRFCRFFVRTNR